MIVSVPWESLCSNKKAPGFPEAFIITKKIFLAVFLILTFFTLFGDYCQFGSFLYFTFFGRAIAAVDFKGGTSCKFRCALKANHLSLAAYFDFQVFLASLETQGLRFLVKTYELCLERFGRATCENGSC